MIVGLNRDGKRKKARKSDDRLEKRGARDRVFHLSQPWMTPINNGINRDIGVPNTLFLGFFGDWVRPGGVWYILT
jgi:hypothetical protein